MLLSAVAAGVENYIDNQKHTPTWKIQLCLIADAIVYVCFGGIEVYASARISLILLGLAGFLTAMVLLAFTPCARSSSASSHDRLTTFAFINISFVLQAY